MGACIHRIWLVLMMLLSLNSIHLLYGQIRTLQPQGTTRAVVVGISEYQDKSIGDLRFAHSDAAAFASYLMSDVGGSVRAEQIRVLTNQAATLGNVASALDWLQESSYPGDNAIIYFSGHGDAIKGGSQEGYILCFDALVRKYSMSGALSLLTLQNVISTLSIEKQTQVFFIADACRSGGIEDKMGVRAFGQDLSRQYENELKLLSCQPHELSHEGTQWGGGSGVFTYYLLEGLTGYADADDDEVITLMEIEQYVKNRVAMDMRPVMQVPIARGELTKTIAVVNRQKFEDIKKRGDNQIITFRGATPKSSILDKMGLLADKDYQDYYFSFIRTLENKSFFSPEEDCTEKWFDLLISDPRGKKMHAELQRTYAAALQDDAQYLINLILNADLDHFKISHVNRSAYYERIPKLLDRSLRLIQSNHILYAELKKRKELFEGLRLSNKLMNSENDSLNQEIIRKISIAIDGKPLSAIAHYHLSRFYAERLNNLDSALIHTELAVSYFPEWVMPYTTMGFNLFKYFKNEKLSRTYFDKALRQSSDHPTIWLSLGGYYNYTMQYDSMVIAYHKVLAIDSLNAVVWANLGVALMTPKTIDESFNALKRSLELDSTMASTHYYMGCLYQLQHNWTEAEKCHLKSLELRPGRVAVLDSLGQIYLIQKEYGKALKVYHDLKNANRHHKFVDAYLAICEFQLGNLSTAKEHLKNWIDSGLKDEVWLCNTPFVSMLCSDGKINQIFLYNNH